MAANTAWSTAAFSPTPSVKYPRWNISRAAIWQFKKCVSATKARIKFSLNDAHFIYTADAHFLDAASAAVAVAAEAVGAAELAGYGHPPGAGSTPAGPNLHLRVKKLASRQSKSNKQRLLRKGSDDS